MGEIDECLYEGAVRAGSVNRRSTRVKVRMKVHLSQLSEFTTLTYLSQDLVAADLDSLSRRPDRRLGQLGGTRGLAWRRGLVDRLLTHQSSPLAPIPRL